MASEGVRAREPPHAVVLPKGSQHLGLGGPKPGTKS